jgi:hypothetical protein
VSAVRWRAPALLVVLAGVGVGAGVLAGQGSGGAAAGASTAAARPVEAEGLLAARLDAKHLNYRYVACIPNGARFENAGVVRCNVNFNAPHIEVYCAVVRDGRLQTNHEHPAIPCPRDAAGGDPPVLTSASKGSGT